MTGIAPSELICQSRPSVKKNNCSNRAKLPIQAFNINRSNRADFLIQWWTFETSWFETPKYFNSWNYKWPTQCQTIKNAPNEPKCQSRPSISIAPTKPIFWYCGGQLKLHDFKYQNILIHEIISDQHNTRLSKTLQMSQIANPGRSNWAKFLILWWTIETSWF